MLLRIFAPLTLILAAGALLAAGRLSASAQTPALSVVIDCDVITAGIQDECDIPANAGSTAVDVVILNHQPDQSFGAVNFNLIHNGQAQLPAQASACVAPGINCNPDLHSDVRGAGWQCVPVRDDQDPRTDRVNSFASCFNGAGDGFLSSSGTTRIARVTYDVTGALGEIPMTLAVVNVADQVGVEFHACNPGAGSCAGATARVVDPVENPPTPLPTATPTADVPMPPALAPIVALDVSSTPSSGMFLALDCAVDIPGLQDRCTYESGSAAEIRVGIVAGNAPILPQDDPLVEAFTAAVLNSSPGLMRSVDASGLGSDLNPDLNDEAPASYTCRALGGLIDCFRFMNGPAFTLVAQDPPALLASVRYAALPVDQDQIVGLSFLHGSLLVQPSEHGGGDCPGSVHVDLRSCRGVTITLVPPIDDPDDTAGSAARNAPAVIDDDGAVGSGAIAPVAPASAPASSAATTAAASTGSVAGVGIIRPPDAGTGPGAGGQRNIGAILAVAAIAVASGAASVLRRRRSA